MILKGQLLDFKNLNAAYISKTDTSEQTISSNLKLAGKVTLKAGGSFVSDNENSGYMQIDAQGNHVVLYDGVNNQKISVFASNGTKATYITSLDTENYGLIDVTSGLDHLEIATNTGKDTKFGGNIEMLSTKAFQITNGTSTYNAILPLGMDANGAGLSIGAGGMLIMGSGESNAAVWASSGYGTYATEQTVIASDYNIYFHSNVQSGWASNKGMIFNSSGQLGINTLTPSQTLDVNGGMEVRGSIIAPSQRAFINSVSMNFTQTVEEVNNAPMYGIGRTSIALADATATQYSVQVGGNYGVNIKTANNELRVGYLNNANGLLFNGNQVWHAGNHSATTGDVHSQYLLKAGGAVTGATSFTAPTLGTTNTDIVTIKGLILEADSRITSITRNSSTNRISSVSEGHMVQGAFTAIRTVTFNRDSGGILTSLTEVVGSTTVTYQIVRNNGKISNINKTVA